MKTLAIFIRQAEKATRSPDTRKAIERIKHLVTVRPGELRAFVEGRKTLTRK